MSSTGSSPVGEDACLPHSEDALREAVRLLGETAELAGELARTLTVDPSPRFRKALLQAMLVSERCLIGFVCGPKASRHPKTGEWRRRPDDVCPQCFISGWRLENKELRTLLEVREGKIGKQIAHLTWPQVEQPREWTINKVDLAIRALAIFAGDLEITRPELGTILRSHLERAGQSAS